MDVAIRWAYCSLAVLAIAIAGGFTGQTPTTSQEGKNLPKFQDARTTYRTYIGAVRKNDLKAAKQCWVIDDDNKSGALDTIIGLWISMRHVNQVAEKKFGVDGLDTVLKGWRRDDVTDQALDLTKNRLEDAEVKIDGAQAQLTIKWRNGDGWPKEAFMFSREPIPFRKIDGNWKIDANKMTGLKHGADFFAKGTWGPMFRDQVAIMSEAVDGMEKGKLKTVKELGVFIEDKIAAMVKECEQERKKDDSKGK